MAKTRRKNNNLVPRFVETAPEFFLCRVCSLYMYLREPQITECCGRNICLPCIEQCQHAGGKCPFCKKPEVKGALNRRVRNELLEREVYCYSKEGGCQWKGKLDQLKAHTEGCGYTEIDCPNDCGTGVKRQDLKVHFETCPRHGLPCKCGETIERRKQVKHLVSCPLTMIQCPFSIAGCRANVMNKDLQSHMDDGLADHLSMVSKQTSEVQKLIKQATKTVDTTRAKKLQELGAEVENLTKGMADMEEKAVSIEKTIQMTEVELAYLEGEKTKTSRVYRSELNRKDAEMKALKQQVSELQHLAKVKTYGIPVVRYSQVFPRPTAPTTQQFVPPIKFIVQKFTDKVNNDALWLSPPFYTYQHGYKFCLKVFCNGVDRGSSNYIKWLSVYVQLVKGEYDHQLNWPFHGSFTVQVNNRIKNSRHLTRKITFSSRTDSSGGSRRRVVDGYFAEYPVGWWNFATQGDLIPNFLIHGSDIKFVVDDSIEISVNNVEVY